MSWESNPLEDLTTGPGSYLKQGVEPSGPLNVFCSRGRRRDEELSSFTGFQYTSALDLSPRCRLSNKALRLLSSRDLPAESRFRPLPHLRYDVKE